MIVNKFNIEDVFNLDEIYSLEDYYSYQMIGTNVQTHLNDQKINKSVCIRALFDFNDIAKEIILNKEYAKKIYTFIKIRYNDKEMNILIHNDNNYQTEIIMKKINSRKNIKGFIKINLGIQKFPLKSYILVETKEVIPDFEKIFLLMKKSENHSDNPNPIYDNLKTTLINNNSINNNLIRTNVYINKNNNNNSKNQNNNNNNVVNNYNNNNNNFQNNQVNNIQNFNNGNNNFVNNNNINSLNPNTSPNLSFNQIQNNFMQSNNYNQNQIMNFNNMNSMNNTPNPSFNNNNFNSSNNMNFNNYQNMNSMNMNSMNSMNSIPMSMNSMSQNSMNSNSMNFMNMNSMNMNSNSRNTPFPMNNQQLQTMPNFNNILLNRMNFNNMGFNLNSNNSMPISNQQNNIQDNQKQNEVKIPDFQFQLSNGLEKELFPYVGLRNVGLTCYMNSTLQCLLHIPELNNYFHKIYPGQSENFRSINKAAETKGKLSKGYFDLMMSVITKNLSENRYSKSVTPNCFHEIIGELNPQFRTFDANDSKDLLIFLIQSMHEELNYFGDKKLEVVPPCDQTIPQKALDFFLAVNTELNLSIFSYLFYGIFKSETECLKCHQKFYNFQYFQILSFPLYI